MPVQKRQHYVPQFYLKEFSNEKGGISLYNFKSDKYINQVPYASQCYKDYYYGKDGLWENKLSLMESKWAVAVKKFKEGLPVEDEDVNLIKQFVLYQRQRTFAEGEFRKQERQDRLKEIAKIHCANRGWIFDGECEKICEEMVRNEPTPLENLEISYEMEELIEDLKVLVITYITERELISSDVPVVAINPFHQHSIGYSCMGLILFLPITRNKVVVIYDGKMYSHFRDIPYTISYDEKEVYNLNILQYISAEKIIFSYKENELKEFRDDIREKREKCRNESPISTLGPESEKLMLSSLRKTLYDCNLSFAGLRHEIRKIPFTCREAVPRQWDEEWAKKLHDKESLISRLYSVKPDLFTPTGLSRKELLQGYRRMSIFADKYWKQQ